MQIQCIFVGLNVQVEISSFTNTTFLLKFPNRYMKKVQLNTLFKNTSNSKNNVLQNIKD